MNRLPLFTLLAFIGSLILGILIDGMLVSAIEPQPTFKISEAQKSVVPKRDTSVAENETQFTFPRYGVYGIKYPSLEPSEIPNITLGITDYDPYSPRRGKPDAVYYVGILEASREFPQTDNSVRIEGQNLSFKTAVVDGVKFHFEGKFSEEIFTKDAVIEQPVLAGKLIKFRHGKKVFDDEIEFLFLNWTETQ